MNSACTRASLIALTTVVMACSPGWQKIDLQTTEDIKGLYGFGPNDVWAVGTGGFATHFDGVSWTPVPLETNRTFESVWGATPDDVWMVGDGVVVRWNGKTAARVSNIPTHAFTGVRGTAANAVYLCSISGTLFYDGDAFSPVTVSQETTACFDISGRPGDGIRIIDGRGTVLAVDKTKPTPVGISGLPTAARSLLAVSATEYWLWADGSSIAHWVRNGVATAVPLTAPPGLKVRSAWASGPFDVWLGGTRGALGTFNGSTWQPSALGDGDAPTLNALWGTPTEMWAAGTNGWVMRIQLPP